MGTTSFDFKAKGMLNFQNFTVYPISKESDFEYVKIHDASWDTYSLFITLKKIIEEN